MEFIIDKSIVELGIKSVAIGIAKNIDPQAQLSDSFLKKQKKMEDWALHCDVEAVSNHPITQGYADMLQRVGRSIKKYPPTVPAFIRNIQRRGSMPHINSVIDIYNVESLHSFLAIGGHDLDKIDGQIALPSIKKRAFFFRFHRRKNTSPKPTMYTATLKVLLHGLASATVKIINLMTEQKMQSLLSKGMPIPLLKYV